MGLLFSFVMSFKDLLIFLPHATEITGFSPARERTYLIIFQNNNELRPTGGFISSYGLLKFKNGRYEGLEVSDVYANTEQANYIAPPYPMTELMGIPGKPFSYSFRDANFFPQFTLAARSLEKMFMLTHQDVNLDGMIAINYSVMEDLLGVMGDVKVGDITFTEENVFETIEREVNDIDKHNIEDLANRKNILKMLTQELEKEIFSRPDIWPDIGRLVMKNLNKKSIQLYFKDYELQKLMVDKGWAGAWTSTTGDFFAVNEANYGGLKSNRYMKKDITYDLSISPIGKAYSMDASLTVDITHYGVDNPPISANYSGYLRTYVPQGAKIVKNTGGEDFRKASETFYNFFSNIIHIAPGSKMTLSYQYKLPAKLIADNKYSLYVPKQSGADDDTYTIIIRLPQGYSVKTDNMEAKENIAFFSGKITKDMNFDLEIIPDINPPYIIYQNIQNLGGAVVIFNENLDKISAGNIANYSLIDSNEKDTKNKDSIKITGAIVNEKVLTILYEGMTFQPEERFILQMNNIKDEHGNKIDSGVKKITLVQRIKPDQLPSAEDDTGTNGTTTPVLTPLDPEYYM